MKVLKICMIPVLFILFLGSGIGQSKDKLKIVVVEKTTDENGNIVTHKVVKEGKDAERYLKDKEGELGIHVDLDGRTKTIKKEVKVEVDRQSESEEKQIRIKIKDGKEVEILEWDGEGEMPLEMKDLMEKENIVISIADSENDEVEVNVEVIEKDTPRLGVFPENHIEGVEIMELVEGSPAEKAGLVEGDIIFKVNDKFVGSVLQLSDRLSKVGEGSMATIYYLRNGREESVKVNL